MHDAVELIDAGTLLIEGKLGNFGAIDGFIGIQNLVAETLDDLFVNLFPGTHQLVRDLVGIDGVRAQLREDLAHQRFAGSDTARESDFEQGFPLPDAKH
jgi:hypothetical protein